MLCPFVVTRESNGRDPVGHLGSKCNAWEVSGVCNNHSSGLSGTQLVCVSVCVCWGAGGAETPSLPRNSAFSPQAGIPASLHCPHGHNGAHSQNPGKHSPCGERMDSCSTQGPSVPQCRPGHKWGQRTAFVPPPSVFPGGRCPLGSFRANALKSQNKNPARG